MRAARTSTVGSGGLALPVLRSRIAVTFLVAAFATGAGGALLEVMPIGLGALLATLSDEATLYVYGPAVASVLGAWFGHESARLREVGVVHGLSWPRQVQQAGLGACGLGAAAGACVAVGAFAVELARNHTVMPPPSIPNDWGYPSRVATSVLLIHAFSCLLGAWVGAALPRFVNAFALLMAVQLPTLPALVSLYGRSSTGQFFLGLLPLNALRGLALGNAGTFLGPMTNAYTRQNAVLGGLVLATWCLFCWAAAVTFRIGGSAPGVRRRARRRDRRRDSGGGRVLSGFVVLMLAAAIGAVTPTWGLGVVSWHNRPSWREDQARGRDSRTVTRRWVEAIRDGRQAEAASWVLDGAAAKIPPEMPEICPPRVCVVSVAPVSQMVGPEQVRVTLTYQPPLVSGETQIDGAALDVALTRVEGVGWRVAGAGYPSLRVAAQGES